MTKHYYGNDPLELPWLRARNAPWRESIAHAEHGGTKNYGEKVASEMNWGYAVGEPGKALGRYQMTGLGLQGAGWKDSSGNWTAKALNHGIGSDADFLSSPDAQEAAMDDYMADNDNQLYNYGASALVGKTFEGTKGLNITITPGGLAAAAHRAGAPTTQKIPSGPHANGQFADRYFGTGRGN